MYRCFDEADIITGKVKSEIVSFKEFCRQRDVRSMNMMGFSTCISKDERGVNISTTCMNVHRRIIYRNRNSPLSPIINNLNKWSYSRAIAFYRQIIQTHSRKSSRGGDRNLSNLRHHCSCALDQCCHACAQITSKWCIGRRLLRRLKFDLVSIIKRNDI